MNNSTSLNVGANATTESRLREHNSYVCMCYDFIIEAVLMGVLCLFGFIGNTVSMICLHQNWSKTATPYLLVSLEVADTLFLCAVFLIRVIASVHTFALQLPWFIPLVPYLNKYIYPTALVAETGTIYLTLLVTFDRYISVCWPYRAIEWCTVRCARRHVIAVMFFAFIFNIPRFFEYEIVVDEYASKNAVGTSHGPFKNTTTSAIYSHQPPDLRTTMSGGIDRVTSSQISYAGESNSSLVLNINSIATVTTELYERQVVPSMTTTNPMLYRDTEETAADGRRITMKHQLTPLALNYVYRLVYTNLLYFFVMFLVPLILVTFLNYRLAAELRRTRRKRARLRGLTGSMPIGIINHHGPGDQRRTSEEDITLMLIVVVVVFVVTQTPAAITQIMDSVLSRSSTGCPNAFFFYARISDLLVVANSSVNFLIYCLCSRQFRRILSSLVCKWPPPGRSAEEHLMEDRTSVQLQRQSRQLVHETAI